jgi:hypothetical protein
LIRALSFWLLRCLGTGTIDRDLTAHCQVDLLLHTAVEVLEQPLDHARLR